MCIRDSTGTVLTTHPYITGDALKVSFPLAEFVEYYTSGLVWDCTTQSYTITGQYNDTSPFSAGDDFAFCGHVSGDLNLDGNVDISDLIVMVDWFFNGAEPPLIPEVGDVDGSGGAPDIADLVYLVDYMFVNGPAPVHP